MFDNYNLLEVVKSLEACRNRQHYGFVLYQRIGADINYLETTLTSALEKKLKKKTPKPKSKSTNNTATTRKSSSPR